MSFRFSQVFEGDITEYNGLRTSSINATPELPLPFPSLLSGNSNNYHKEQDTVSVFGLSLAFSPDSPNDPGIRLGPENNDLPQFNRLDSGAVPNLASEINTVGGGLWPRNK